MATSGIAAVPVDWRSALFEGLSLQDREKILAAAKPRRFAANSVITNQEHPADRLFLLTKGRARYFFDEHGGGTSFCTGSRPEILLEERHCWQNRPRIFLALKR